MTTVGIATARQQRTQAPERRRLLERSCTPVIALEDEHWHAQNGFAPQRPQIAPKPPAQQPVCKHEGACGKQQKS